MAYIANEPSNSNESVVPNLCQQDLKYPILPQENSNSNRESVVPNQCQQGLKYPILPATLVSLSSITGQFLFHPHSFPFYYTMVQLSLFVIHALCEPWIYKIYIERIVSESDSKYGARTHILLYFLTNGTAICSKLTILFNFKHNFVKLYKGLYKSDLCFFQTSLDTPLLSRHQTSIDRYNTVLLTAIALYTLGLDGVTINNVYQQGQIAELFMGIVLIVERIVTWVMDVQFVIILLTVYYRFKNRKQQYSYNYNQLDDQHRRHMRLQSGVLNSYSRMLERNNIFSFPNNLVDSFNHDTTHSADSLKKDNDLVETIKGNNSPEQKTSILTIRNAIETPKPMRNKEHISILVETPKKNNSERSETENENKHKTMDNGDDNTYLNNLDINPEQSKNDQIKDNLNIIWKKTNDTKHNVRRTSSILEQLGREANKPEKNSGIKTRNGKPDNEVTSTTGSIFQMLLNIPTQDKIIIDSKTFPKPPRAFSEHIGIATISDKLGTEKQRDKNIGNETEKREQKDEREVGRAELDKGGKSHHIKRPLYSDQFDFVHNLEF
ncbi:hypothetical protein WDU94_003190 [Cyamophila willieti]